MQHGILLLYIAGTYEKAADMAAEDFISRGINCIEYANGARHTIKDYADMALRTAAKRAYLTGEGEKRMEWGISTVIMNKRGNPCPKCLPFVGKVLIDDVWSGGSREDGDYPLMSRAIELGLYHPRCRDSHSTYFEGISTPPDDSFSKREVEEIKEGYTTEQKRRAAMNNYQKFSRLADNALDKENKQKYKAKADYWHKEYARYYNQGYKSGTKLKKDTNSTKKRMADAVENVENGGIIKVNRTTTIATPNTVTQVVNKKGGVDRNYYDSDGRLKKQLSNHNHGNSKRHPLGKKGEHVHDYIYDDEGNVVARPMRELTEEERKENEDIL